MNKLKKLITISFLVVVSLFATNVQAKVEYQEGVHYVDKGTPLSKTKEIREFFSFWCGHCFALQEDFDFIKEKFSGKANFEINPIGLLGGSAGPFSQKALAVASINGISDEFRHTLFRRMHIENKIPLTQNDYVEVFESLGINKAKYEKEVNSFVVQGMVSTWNKLTDDLEIDAVPEIVVNGRYLVVMEEFDSVEELCDLIAYLLDKDK